MSAMRRLSLEPLEPRRLLSRSTISTLISSAPSATLGTAITFTDRVTSTAGVPSGSVEFMVDGRATSLVQLRGGAASFADKALAIGKHTIVAEFVPQRGTVWISSSAKLTESVAAPPAPATPASQNLPDNYVLGGTLQTGSEEMQGGTLTLAAGTFLPGSGTINIASQVPPPATPILGGPFQTGTGTLAVDPQGGVLQLTGSTSALNSSGGTLQLQSGSALNLNAGTLNLNIPSGSTTLGTINVNSQGLLNTLNVLPITASNLSPLGPGFTPVSGTIYSGNTVVGDGTNAATLTANQILQNTITVSSGSSVVINPAAGSLAAGVAPID
jgi:hypothetical protein